MTLQIKQSFTITGVNGEDGKFSSPFINDKKELEFKYCSFYEGKVTLDIERKGLLLENGKRKVLLRLKSENEDVYNEMLIVRNLILMDLRELTKRYKEGSEDLIAFPYENEQYPFLITTQSILDNGIFSTKYSKSVLYFLNEEFKKRGKPVVASYESMLETVGKAIQKMERTQLKEGYMGKDKYFKVTISSVAEAV